MLKNIHLSVRYCYIVLYSVMHCHGADNFYFCLHVGPLSLFLTLPFHFVSSSASRTPYLPYPNKEIDLGILTSTSTLLVKHGWTTRRKAQAYVDCSLCKAFSGDGVSLSLRNVAVALHLTSTQTGQEEGRRRRRGRQGVQGKAKGGRCCSKGNGRQGRQRWSFGRWRHQEVGIEHIFILYSN